MSSEIMAPFAAAGGVVIDENGVDGSASKTNARPAKRKEGERAR
jgi:hypothetical protein